MSARLLHFRELSAKIYKRSMKCPYTVVFIVDEDDNGSLLCALQNETVDPGLKETGENNERNRVSFFKKQEAGRAPLVELTWSTSPFVEFPRSSSLGRPPHSRAPPGRASTVKSWPTNLLGQQMCSWDRTKKEKEQNKHAVKFKPFFWSTNFWSTTSSRAPCRPLVDHLKSSLTCQGRPPLRRAFSRAHMGRASIAKPWPTCVLKQNEN